jgi:hypothetical protein
MGILHQFLFCVFFFLFTNKAWGDNLGPNDDEDWHSKGKNLARYQVPKIASINASNLYTTIVQNTGLQVMLCSWTRQQ